MSLKIAVQMDPIARINIKGDSTFALLLEAEKRGHSLSYYTTDRLAMRDGRVFTTVESLKVRDQADSNSSVSATWWRALTTATTDSATVVVAINAKIA